MDKTDCFAPCTCTRGNYPNLGYHTHCQASDQDWVEVEREFTLKLVLTQVRLCGLEQGASKV